MGIVKDTFEYGNSESKKITEAQRKCLSHIFRNCEQAIYGLLELIDDPYSQVQLKDFVHVLPNVCQELNLVLNAARSGTFCAIPKADCRNVAPFVGCEGIPDLGNSNLDLNRSKLELGNTKSKCSALKVLTD